MFARTRVVLPTSDLPERPTLTRSLINAILISLAILTLAVGIMVYLTDRPPFHAVLIPGKLSFNNGSLFGALGNWLPSFVHPFAFSLLSAAIRAPSAAPAYGTCAAWWAVNVLFEIGQHPLIQQVLTERLLPTLDPGWLLRPVTNYLLLGTFDFGDLVAATLGALAAAALFFLLDQWELHHAS